MATLLDIIERAKLINRNSIDTMTMQCFDENKEEIVALNTDDQMYNKGIDAKGHKIEPMYRPSTIAKKKRLNLPFDHVTLYQTGKLHDHTHIDVRKTKIRFINDDPKYFKLTEKYGENLLGLTPENLDFVAKKIIGPALAFKIKFALL